MRKYFTKMVIFCWAAKKLSVSAVVDASGLVVIERVFKNGILNLK